MKRFFEKCGFSLSVLMLLVMAVMTVIGDQGLVELHERRSTQEKLLATNRQLIVTNQALLDEIDRLKNDREYIESIVRQSLKLVGKDDIVVETRKGAS